MTVKLTLYYLDVTYLDVTYINVTKYLVPITKPVYQSWTSLFPTT